jgi:hypothetical protein
MHVHYSTNIFMGGGEPFVMLILMYAYTIIYMCRITFVIKD